MPTARDDLVYVGHMLHSAPEAGKRREDYDRDRVLRLALTHTSSSEVVRLPGAPQGTDLPRSLLS